MTVSLVMHFVSAIAYVQGQYECSQQNQRKDAKLKVTDIIGKATVMFSSNTTLISRSKNLWKHRECILYISFNNLKEKSNIGNTKPAPG